MQALRSFTRVLPRATLRACATPVRASYRYTAIARPTIISRTTPYKAFSTTRTWREAAGDADAELSAKLEHERTLELENKENPDARPQNIEDFLADSHWTVLDQPGTENIVLTRQFGNETIKVECSIADVNAPQEMDELDEDAALDDEPDFGSDVTSGGKRTINQSQAGKFDAAPEDSIAPSDRDIADEDQPSSFPLSLSITIDKGTAGATHISAETQDGTIEIKNVHYYPRGELVDPSTPDQIREAQNVYGGPPFLYLDQDLQSMYEQYIQDRGIDTSLSVFLTSYVDWKEQREYLKWLQDLKNFIDA